MYGSAFIGGLAIGALASAHCAGMCGAFPLHLARASHKASVPARQLLYVAGKAFTYAFLGALCGALGSTLVASGLLPNRQLTMTVVGAAIILLGLGMVGVKLPSPISSRFNAYEWGFVKSIYGHFFAHPGYASSFLLGIGNGFLPCPITMAALAMAAATQSVLQGIVVGLGLGVGTAPVLLGIGLFGGLVDARWRRIGLRPAGIVVIALGLMTVLRTQGLIQHGCHSHAATPAGQTAVECGHCKMLGHTCPHCAAKKAGGD